MSHDPDHAQTRRHTHTHTQTHDDGIYRANIASHGKKLSTAG